MHFGPALDISMACAIHSDFLLARSDCRIDANQQNGLRQIYDHRGDSSVQGEARQRKSELPGSGAMNGIAAVTMRR